MWGERREWGRLFISWCRRTWLARRQSPGDAQEVIFPSSPSPEENILKPYLDYNFRMENKSELFMLWKSHVHKQRKIRE